MTIESIIKAGKGKSHEWEVTHCERMGNPYGSFHQLIHFRTTLLEWDHETKAITYKNVGWGSVSDANGLNTAFRVLDAEIRMFRDAKGGGPRFSEVNFAIRGPRP